MIFLSHCTSKSTNGEYLNLSDSVDYVGVEVCKNCHYDKYETFMHTGMGQSFGLANPLKSSANIHEDSIIIDVHKNLHYYPYWDKDSLKLKEYRLFDGDTIFNRVEKADYIIGSGQHTNSHIYNVNGYLHQMPFTYYTQEERFDFPPGFEDGMNTRFDRKIGLECMTCHNSLPSFVLGSENKYEKVHLGISCERCHGPGAIHVEEKMKGNFVDTAHTIDYTIVHPGKISSELQFEICSRCHLQGNAVLEEGKTFLDFKPGMFLKEVMDVYVPKYEGDQEFIMASHVDRLKMSKCFEQAKGKLTCVTCHNPHKSVKITSTEVFNKACVSCHKSQKIHHVKEVGEDCVACHMPKSGSSDIPHVRVTDHKISVPSEVSASQQDSLKKFIGLHCVNNSTPSKLSILRAYLQQYEKFEQEQYYLDSAWVYLNQLEEEDCTNEWVQFYFFKSEYLNVISWFEKKEFEFRKEQFNKKSHSNLHAWTWYRIGESYYKLSKWSESLQCYERASYLAPYHLEIQNKYALALMRNQRLQKAKEVFEFIISENPKFEKVYANYGYLYSLMGDFEAAAKQYEIAIGLNPDRVITWLNYAAYYLYKEDVVEAKYCLKQVLRINLNHKKAKQLLDRLK